MPLTTRGSSCSCTEVIKGYEISLDLASVKFNREHQTVFIFVKICRNQNAQHRLMCSIKNWRRFAHLLFSSLPSLAIQSISSRYESNSTHFRQKKKKLPGIKRAVNYKQKTSSSMKNNIICVLGNNEV